MYFADSGLAAHLLGFESARMLEKSTFFSPLHENLVASEIVKAQINAGRKKELYYFRDSRGLEVDFLVRGSGHRLFLLEVKATRTIRPEAAEPISRPKKTVTGYVAEAFIVHLPSESLLPRSPVRPGVRAISVRDIADTISGGL